MKDRKESINLEFKKSVGEWKEIVETVSAFSNTNGGKIVVGASNSGIILGIRIGKDTIEDLTNKIVTNTDPKVYPKIAVEKIGKKNIIIIEVNESTDKLVLAFGRPFKRVGKSTVRMSKDEYEKIILEKHSGKLQFDKQICEGTNLKDINWDFIKEKFIPLYEKVSGKRIVGSLKSLLESLECVRREILFRKGRTGRGVYYILNPIYKGT